MSTERQHWRSLGQLEGTPESRAFREREFVEGASEPLDAVSRREVLTLLGASLSLAGLAACRRPEETIVPYVEAPEQVVPGIPRHYATTMPSGNTAYGLVVESHEGRPTKIEGNELHPGSLGSSSARVQAAILDLYDPDRSQEVLKDGEASSWDAFVAAWVERAAVHAADGGAGLAVLLPPSSSPTLFRLVEELRLVYPNARVAVHDAAGARNSDEGIALAAGKPLVPVHRLENADVVLCLDADILHADPEMIRHTRGFARRRQVSGPEDGMSRLWAVEPVLSVTGAKADHRLRLPAHQVRAFTAALAALLAEGGLETGARPASIAGVDPEWLKALAEDLLAHQGTSLIVAGPHQPRVVHAVALALNVALGNVGTTVEYHEPVDALQPGFFDLPGLVHAMNGGEVGTLLVLGTNPAYDAPAALGFAAAAESVDQIVHLGAHRDETASLAHWHLPAAHFLEAWGDARAACGTLSVVQPLILPLYGGKSTVEVLGLVTRGDSVPGYELVRETWRGVLGEDDFESRWRRVLHDGVLPDSATPAVDVEPAREAFVELAAGPALVPEAAVELELLFRPCPKVHDGREANNAWLQELPDAITKVTWDNPLLLSPATAAAHGLDDGDVVRLEVDDRSLEIPVFRVPGMADGTLVLTLGYGRRAGGRVANGVGFDAYAVRPFVQLDAAGSVRIQAVGRRHPLAQTQEHGTMDGRHLVREATLDHYREEPHFAQEHVEEAPLWPEHEYKTRPQWGMVIDLNACTGCNACAVACQSENNIPVVGKDQVSKGREMAWIRVDRYFTGEPADAGAVFQPVPCMHCENAPCEQVCPVAATMHDEQGLNVMVYNRCIGTRYCSNNCPYKVRRFNFFNYTKDTPEPLKMAHNPDVTVRSRGVMEKCTYCVQRLSSAKIDARLGGRELRDGDAKTACQQACPAEAIHFGDLEDLESRVRKARGLDRTYAILGELNSRPRTTYQARLSNPHPALAGDEEEKGHA